MSNKDFANAVLGKLADLEAFVIGELAECDAPAKTPTTVTGIDSMSMEFFDACNEDGDILLRALMLSTPNAVAVKWTDMADVLRETGTILPATADTICVSSEDSPEFIDDNCFCIPGDVRDRDTDLSIRAFDDTGEAAAYSAKLARTLEALVKHVEENYCLEES